MAITDTLGDTLYFLSCLDEDYRFDQFSVSQERDDYAINCLFDPQQIANQGEQTLWFKQPKRFLERRCKSGRNPFEQEIRRNKENGGKCVLIEPNWPFVLAHDRAYRANCPHDWAKIYVRVAFR